jgi:hypothetical protein
MTTRQCFGLAEAALRDKPEIMAVSWSLRTRFLYQIFAQYPL